MDSPSLKSHLQERMMGGTNQNRERRSSFQSSQSPNAVLKADDPISRFPVELNRFEITVRIGFRPLIVFPCDPMPNSLKSGSLGADENDLLQQGVGHNAPLDFCFLQLSQKDRKSTRLNSSHSQI